MAKFFLPDPFFAFPKESGTDHPWPSLGKGFGRASRTMPSDEGPMVEKLGVGRQSFLFGSFR